MKNKLSILLTAAACLSLPSLARAQSSVYLGSASTFAVLAGSTVTNTGNTIIYGDIGVSPGASVSGFPSGVDNNGTIYAGGSTAAQAETDAATAYDFLLGEATGSTDLSGQDLGTLTLTPGVYQFSAAAQLTGTLVLNGEGNPNAQFDFLIGTTLTTATGSQVNFLDGGQAANVFWQVGTSATLGTSTDFSGTILANTSITDNGTSTVAGRLLALNGAVTLNDDFVAVPEPADASLLMAGLSGLVFGFGAIRRRLGAASGRADA
jgi:type VI secretion system secreted protein VgrG